MKATKEQFAKLWADLGLGLGLTRGPGDEFARIEAAYSDPRRKYHTLEHIGWGLHRLDEMAEEDKTRGGQFAEREWSLIRWAFWFHDFALDGSPEDEATSAMAARHAAEAAGMSLVDCSTIATLIFATAHDRVPLRHDAAIICDADLSILGSPDEAFDHYESLVREEWAHVPEKLFAAARLVILKRFADRPWIYMTDYGRTRWERKARANLERSMAALKELSK